MLAALLLNPHPSSSPVRPRRRRWRFRNMPIEEVKELYNAVREEVPKIDQVGLLSHKGMAWLPPVSRIDLDSLRNDIDTLVAMAGELDKATERKRRKKDEEAFLVSLFYAI